MSNQANEKPMVETPHPSADGRVFRRPLQVIPPVARPAPEIHQPNPGLTPEQVTQSLRSLVLLGAAVAGWVISAHS